MGKFIRRFINHNNYSNLIFDYTNTPNISKCILENEIHYQKKLYPHFNLLDILYVNSNGEKKVDSNILDPSEGYIPIGLCIAETGFFGDNEPARFMSLKYMNTSTPDIGSLLKQNLYFGNKGTTIDGIANMVRPTHINGDTREGYFTADWITETNHKIPSLFDENNNWNLTELGNVNQYVVTHIIGKENTIVLTNDTCTSNQLNWKTDTEITHEFSTGYSPAACCCWRYHTLGTQQGDWYFGAAGELSMIVVLKPQINTKLSQISSLYSSYCITTLGSGGLNTSTRYDINGSWQLNFWGGNITYTYSSSAAASVLALLQY